MTRTERTYSKHEQELYDLATAYYRLSRLALEMETAKDRKGNRTQVYTEALTALKHAKDHIWQDIRATIIICGIAQPDGVMDAAYNALCG